MESRSVITILIVLAVIAAGPSAQAARSKAKPKAKPKPVVAADSKLELNPQVEIQEVVNPELDVPLDVRIHVQPRHRQRLLEQITPNMPEAERLRLAFEIYLEARLEGRKSGLRADVRKIVDNVTTRVVKSADGVDSAASHWADTGEVGIAQWVQRGTLDYYIYLVHELEHILQLHANFGGFRRLFGLIIYPTEENRKIYRYAKELGAVRAEFDFLRLIPEFLLPKPLNPTFLPIWQAAQAGDFVTFHKGSRYPNRDVADPWTQN